jgi:tetratricopeptide (TPR) repeat protein
MSSKPNFIVLALIFLFLPCRFFAQDDPVGLFNKGNDLLINKDFQGAINAYNKALELDPNLYYIYASRAEAKTELGEFKNALNDYNLYKKLVEDLNLLGDAEILDKRKKLMALLSTTEAEQAAENPAFAEEAMEILNSDESLKALYYRAKLEFENGDLNNAIRDFTTAIHSDSNFTAAWVGRGFAYLKQRDMRAAYADFDYAVFLKPTDYNALIGRGEAKDKLRNFSGAIDDFNAAINIAPGKFAAFYDRGLTYFNQKQYAKAEEDFGTVIKLNNKHARAYFNRAVAKVNLRRSVDACMDFKMAQSLGHSQAGEYVNRFCR